MARWRCLWKWKRKHVNMLKKFYAYADVGRTGLCNMLFPWSRAVLFAMRNNCEMIAPSWTKFFRLGQWLRNERDKRYYTGQFTNAGYVTGLRRLVLLTISRSNWINECDASALTMTGAGGVVVFRGLGKYFEELLGGAEFIKQELVRIVNPRIMSRLSELPPRYIGVHVRRGDFASTGQSLPMDYYRQGIDAARNKIGEDIPVLIFSDSRPHELRVFNDIKNVRIMPPAPAIHDVLALSQSAALVGTNHSSFSEWASFLGGMPSFWSIEGRSPSKGINTILV